MKILIIDYYYPYFLNHLYESDPGLGEKKYKDQQKTIFGRFFGVADFYSTNLIKLNHRAKEIIYNNESGQKQWAKENNIIIGSGYFSKIPKLRTWFRSNWEDKILEAQINNFEPDIIYCQNLKYPDQKFLKKIKKRTGLIIGQAACRLEFNKNNFEAFDLILTSFPHYVAKFKKIGLNSEYFKIGFEAGILEKLKKTKEEYGAVFVGGFSKHHKGAVETFEYLAKNSRLNFWGYGSENLPADSIIKKSHHGEAWGIDMYNILYNSKISINRHINAAENNANNMRLYESTGIGTMLITDHKDNINELFKVGEEIETYKSKEELLEKINYYLKHENERKKIAAAGQKRTLRDHTYEARMKELVQIINKYLR